jgi:hypothetical protein
MINIPSRSTRSERSGLSIRLCSRALALAIIPAFTLVPIKADCLPSVPNGWHVVFTMSTHGTDSVVTYAVGTLFRFVAEECN